MGGEAKEQDMTLNWSSFALWFLKQVQQQGFAVILLIGVSGLFLYRNTKLETKVDILMESRLEQSEKEKTLLQTIIQENTRAMDRNTRALQTFSTKNGS